MTEAEALRDLTETEGWRYLDNLSKREIATKLERLTTHKFADLAEVARLQGEIAGLTRVFSYVNNRLDERGKE